MSSSYYLIVDGEAIVNGTLTLTTGRLNQGTVHARGNIVHTTGFSGGTGLLKIDGEGDQTLTGAGSETLGTLPSVLIDKSSGNLTLAGGTIRLGGNWTESSAGTLSVNGTKLVFAGTSGTLVAKTTLADLKVAVSSSYYLTVVGEATVDGTLTLAGGRLNGGMIHARGNVTCETGFGSSTGGSAVLRFDGTGDQTLTGAGSETLGCLPKVEVDKISGTLALAGGVIRAAQDWVVKNGTVNAGTAKVMLVGYSTQVRNGVFYDLVVKKGATWATATLVGALSIAHDLDVDTGELVVGTNPITLNGTEAQNFNPAGAEVTNLSITNVGGTVTMVGGLTGRKLSLAAGSSVVFTAGQTYRFIELEMEGTTEAPITLRSSSTGTQWLLDVPEHAAVYHVDVKDSNASLGSPVTDVSGTDSGANLNWLFRAPAYVAITTPASSVTSPAWVEGDCGADVSELEVTVNSGEPFAAAMETPIRWYADNASAGGKAMGIELSPDAATAVSVTAAGAKGGETTVGQNIEWAVTDIATSSSSITIRQGDSLLLTATGEGEELTIDANGDSTVDFTGEPGETYAAAYPTAGVYDAVARIDDEVVGTLTVTVVSVTMSSPMACQVGYERTKELPVVPAGALSSVSFLSNADVQMSVSIDAPVTGGVRLKLTAHERGTPVLQARLDGATGPMLALREVDEFTLDISAREMVLINGDTREGPGTVIMRPYVPNLELHFYMNSSQSRFLRDGEEVSTYNVNTSDEDEVEQVFDAFTGETVGQHVNIFHVPVGEDSYCWQVQVKQPGPTTVTVGTSGGVNGPVNELYLGGAVLFVRENNNEDADSEQAVETWESSGVGPDPVEERRLSFIESGSAGAWKMTATTEALYGRETDRSWSAPEATEQYVSRGNFRSYVPPYQGDEEGEELTWPLDGYWEEFNDEVADGKVLFKPGIQYGMQDLEVSSSACGVLVKFPEKIIIARLEVDGAIPADPEEPLSDTNITSSTRDPFPRVIGELPERTVEYVEVEGEQNAKPIAILKVAADQAVWSGSGNLSVNFDASASYDPDAEEGESLVYKWDYEGTGNWEAGTATGAHVYAPRTEPYVAKLKVSDVDETESQVAEFQRIIVHQNPTDAEPEPTPVVPDPLGTPVQVTLYTAPGASVDVKLKVNIAEDETEGMAFVSLSGARKECNTPEYFSMTAGPNGYASCIVYLQGVHYSTVADSIQLIVEGKEKVASAKGGPDKHIEWNTSQQDDDGRPFILTEEERFAVEYVHGMWMTMQGQEAQVASPAYPEEEAPFAHQPGTPGGPGGFGGPPAGSGFGALIDAFRIENFSLSDEGTGAPGIITLTLTSNVAAYSQDYTLTETTAISNVFVDSNDSLAIQVYDYPAHNPQAVDTMSVYVVTTVFGTMRAMTLYETGNDTSLFKSERLQLVVTMSALPTNTQIDSITATLSSNLTTDTASGTLTETASASNEFRSADDSFVLKLDRVTAIGVAAKDDFTATVTSSLLDVQDASLDAIETTADSLVFRTDALHNQDQPVGARGALKAIGAKFTFVMKDANDWSARRRVLLYRVRGTARDKYPDITHLSGDTESAIWLGVGQIHLIRHGPRKGKRQVVEVRLVDQAVKPGAKFGIEGDWVTVKAYVEPGDRLIAIYDRGNDGTWDVNDDVFADLTVLRLEFVQDTNGDHTVDPTDAETRFVRVGLWDNAFRTVADTHGAVDTLFNEEPEVENFVGRDSRRFYVRMADPAANRNPSVAEEAVVEWYTLHANGSNDDRPANAGLTLTETGPNTGVFVSRAVMLVSDGVDRNQPTNTGLAAHPGLAAYNQTNHRTRQVSHREADDSLVDGQVMVAYTPLVHGPQCLRGAPVFDRSSEERRVMRVRIFNFQDTANPPRNRAAIPAATIERDLVALREVYAKAGVRVVGGYDPTTDLITLPAGSPVDLDSVGVCTGAFGTLAPHADQTALIGLVRTVDPATPANTNTLYILYIGTFIDGGALGESFPDGWLPPASIARNFVFVAGRHGSLNEYIAPHEVGHMVTNAVLTASEANGTTQGWANGGHYGGAQERFNLMRRFMPVTATPRAVTDSKRLWDDAGHFQQITRIRATRYMSMP